MNVAWEKNNAKQRKKRISLTLFSFNYYLLLKTHEHSPHFCSFPTAGGWGIGGVNDLHTPGASLTNPIAEFFLFLFSTAIAVWASSAMTPCNRVSPLPSRYVMWIWATGGAMWASSAMAPLIGCLHSLLVASRGFGLQKGPCGLRARWLP